MSTTPKPDRLMEILDVLDNDIVVSASGEWGQLKAEAHAKITGLMGEVIGENTGLFEGRYAHEIKNELRAEQRQRLTALTTPDKAEEIT